MFAVHANIAVGRIRRCVRVATTWRMPELTVDFSISPSCTSFPSAILCHNRLDLRSPDYASVRRNRADPLPVKSCQFVDLPLLPFEPNRPDFRSTYSNRCSRGRRPIRAHAVCLDTLLHLPIAARGQGLLGGAQPHRKQVVADDPEELGGTSRRPSDYQNEELYRRCSCRPGFPFSSSTSPSFRCICDSWWSMVRSSLSRGYSQSG